MAMALDPPPTVVPLPTAPARQEMLVTPKDVVTTSAPTLPVVTAVLPKQVRIPVVSDMSQPTVANNDIAQAPTEGLQPAYFRTCCHSS